jgi:hypothetical protein
VNATLPASDLGILRTLGLVLERDEHGTARPAAVTSTPIVWRRCAWCSGILGVIPVEQHSAGMFSDGICPSCRQQFFSAVPTRAAA